MSSEANRKTLKQQLDELAKPSARALLAVCLLAAACSFIGIAAPVWPLELCSHFKLEYTIVLFIGLLLYFPFISRYTAGKKLIVFVILTAALIPSACSVIQLYLPSDVRCTAHDSSPKLKFIQINVNAFNTKYEKAYEYIQAEAPDIVSFEEFSYDWEKAMNSKLTDYPYRASFPSEEGNFGIAVYSKIPPRSKAELIGNKEIPPSWFISFDFDGKPFSVIFTHTVPPISQAFCAIRDKELEGFVKLRKENGQSFMICGDFNCTPWSPIYQKICREAELFDSELGSGLQPSWPVQFIFLRIPIDHFLISKDLCVIERKIGPDVGSDHFPVCMTLTRKH